MTVITHNTGYVKFPCTVCHDITPLVERIYSASGGRIVPFLFPGLVRLHCRGIRGGNTFPPHPHFLLCAGLSFPVGCALTARGGGLCPPYLSACGGQLFTARFAGCGRGPSLRCVHLRRTCSSLPASAAAEPCSPFTSAARRIPRFFHWAAMLFHFTYPVLCANRSP